MFRHKATTSRFSFCSPLRSGSLPLQLKLKFEAFSRAVKWRPWIWSRPPVDPLAGEEDGEDKQEEEEGGELLKRGACENDADNCRRLVIVIITSLMTRQ